MPLFGPPNVWKLKQDKDVKGLIKALEYKKDSSIRLEAADELGLIGSVKHPITLAIEPLIAALRDDADVVRKMAALSLVRIINAWSPDEPNLTKIVNALVAAYKRDEDIDFKLRVIDAIVKIEADAAVDVLCTVYKNETGAIKYAVLLSLGNIGEKPVKQRKSTAAAKAAGQFVFEMDNFKGAFKPGAIEEIKAKQDARQNKIENILVSALNDNDRNLWIPAALSLGNMQDARAEKKLTSLLNDVDTDTRIRNAAVQALNEIKGIR